MRLLLVLTILGVLLLVVSAKKQLEENVDNAEADPSPKEHNSKKYSKDFQKSHHHGHKHKKNNAQKEQPKEEAKSKNAPVEVPEAEIQLQDNIETSKKAVDDRKRKDQTEDLHLQDLTYEENLKKDKKKKKGHHGAHYAEVIGNDEKNEQKLFGEQEAKNPVGEKVIEDSFQPLKNTEGGKKNRGKDKKSKDRSKNKKSSEKNKDKSKKSKNGKNKNKDKKHKNEEKKW